MAKFEWTDSLVALLQGEYEQCRTDEMSNADTFKHLQDLEEFEGLSVPQLRGKAVIAGFYKGDEKAKAKSGGKKAPTKAAIVAAVETILSVPQGALASLDKATVKDLNLLQDALIKAGSKPEYGKQ